MSRDTSINSVLLIGSGPIVIGQACEFDYSGSQAATSLRDEGIEVILINSNPATIMTDPSIADHIYLKPLNVDSIREILAKHDIDAVLPTMGGQTALNLCKDAEDAGIWEEHGVRIIGVDIRAIDLTENRESFRALMDENNIATPPSRIAKSFLEGKEVAQELGYPLIIRASYTLGGSGGSFVKDQADFEEKLRNGLDISPVHEVLIDKALTGYREFELELLRDKDNNIVIICPIENMDPMGIHTGDSVTVAPAMTLTDKSYQQMRDMAKIMMKSLGTFSGGCNVQFAQDPKTEEIIAIEINPRVSRSSALASKATGFPIAKIAAKLSLGYRLDELKNPVTKTTSAFFEPSIDYVVVKIPRWNFEKFTGADATLGPQMKSVGEAMAIGRNFQEALQKGCQSLESGHTGLVSKNNGRRYTAEEIVKQLETPSANSFFFIKEAIELGIPFKTIQKLTQMDRWFILQIQQLVKLEKELRRYNLHNLSADFLKDLKERGFSDDQIARILECEEDEVYAKRKELGIKRTYKIVDTCAAEFPSETPYFYSTFDKENESKVSEKEKIIVIGAGPNRIGQGIEFDYCCVHGVRALKEAGFETIMINCNPETVSTDFDTSDKLYFEPVYWEHIREIIELEQPKGIVVQLGGQTALKMAETFYNENIPIIGTSFKNMDIAEDRGSFSELLETLEIPYPKFGVAQNAEEAIKIANKVGYPVLVRPSYVLGGQDMRIVINDQELENLVLKLTRSIPGNRILIDHFLDRAEEAETDSICDGDEVRIMGIMEHIEPAGIHSGDSYAVLPPYNFSENVMEQIRDYTKKIAFALDIRGLINIQFAVKDEQVYVIEANPRASRTMPFMCKAYNEPYLNYATKIMAGTHKLKDFDINPKLEGFAIKEPVFSFEKFPNVNKELGPEMKSTGEGIRFINDVKDDYFRQLFRQKSMYLSK